MWIPLHCYVSRKRSIKWAFLACDSILIVTFHEKDQLTVHSCHVFTSALLRSARKIIWPRILGMWLLLHRYVQRERSIDCAFLACDYLFIVTFSEKDQVTVHSWPVITSSSLRSARKINWLCILGMWLSLHRYGLRERWIDWEFLACDYLFIVTFSEKDKLTVHSWHVIISSSLRSARKMNWLGILGMWLPLHRYVQRER